jgi:hypothetical protein
VNKFTCNCDAGWTGITCQTADPLISTTTINITATTTTTTATTATNLFETEQNCKCLDTWGTDCSATEDPKGKTVENGMTGFLSDKQPFYRCGMQTACDGDNNRNNPIFSSWRYVDKTDPNCNSEQFTAGAPVKDLETGVVTTPPDEYWDYCQPLTAFYLTTTLMPTSTITSIAPIKSEESAAEGKDADGATVAAVVVVLLLLVVVVAIFLFMRQRKGDAGHTAAMDEYQQAEDRRNTHQMEENPMVAAKRAVEEAEHVARADMLINTAMYDVAPQDNGRPVMQNQTGANVKTRTTMVQNPAFQSALHTSDGTPPVLRTTSNGQLAGIGEAAAPPTLTTTSDGMLASAPANKPAPKRNQVQLSSNALYQSADRPDAAPTYAEPGPGLQNQGAAPVYASIYSIPSESGPGESESDAMGGGGAPHYSSPDPFAAGGGRGGSAV